MIRREIRGEKKYQLRTTGIDDLSSSLSLADREHASIYQPVNFYTAEKLFGHIDADDLSGTFMDVGCGKGRVLAIAAAYGFREIIGIDLSPMLCHQAVQLAEDIEERNPGTSVIIECEDAREYIIPDDVSVLFLFNPFDEFVMKDFLERVSQTLQENPRRVKVLYANPQGKQLWLDAGFREINSFSKMKYLEGCVLVNET